jgi:tetratricopeptide (TPR) repeat protein
VAGQLKQDKSMHFKLNIAFTPFLAGLFIAAFSVSPVFAQAVEPPCGELYSFGQYGPYDYRTDHDKLPIVLSNHFTPKVEALLEGITSLTPGSDIDYTLRAIPNNHRALLSMMRLGVKENTTQPRGSRYTVECWFERAIRFRPDDSIVRMIYSTFLNGSGRITDANAQLELATTFAKDSAITHYNIGLHYFELKNLDKALAQAHKALALGFERVELREQLLAVGKWKEPANSLATPSTDNSTVDLAK